jgi:4-azaleucine resistance transporter AzlC
MTPTGPDLASPSITITWAGVRRGCRASSPLIPGILVFGMLCGVVARQAGLSFVENLLLNLFVFSGAAQLAAIDQWIYPLPLASIVITTLLINLRFLMAGIAAQPWLRAVDQRYVYPTLAVVTDQGWTTGMLGYQKGERDAGYFVGTNGLIWPIWGAAACVGYVVGTGIGDPARIGLDFSITVIFAANLVSAWRGRADLLPWVAAAGVSLVTWWLVPGNWYVMAGGIAGFTAGYVLAPSPTPAVVHEVAP